MGELSAQTLAARGVLGYVVDGGSRDTDLVLAQGFPVFCSFLTPVRHRRALDSRPLRRAGHDRRGHDRDRRLPARRPRRRRDHPARARRRRRHEDRGGRRHRERHAPRADRRHGSGRGVQQVWQVLTAPARCARRDAARAAGQHRRRAAAARAGETRHARRRRARRSSATSRSATSSRRARSPRARSSSSTTARSARRRSAIAPGDYVHTHNVESNYLPTYTLPRMSAPTALQGYLRADGRKGIRNVARRRVPRRMRASRRARDRRRRSASSGVHLIGFPGCYPNAYALEMMEKLCTHPNVGGALLVSLGCEGFDKRRLARTIEASGRPVQHARHPGHRRHAQDDRRGPRVGRADAAARSRRSRPVPMGIDELDGRHDLRRLRRDVRTHRESGDGRRVRPARRATARRRSSRKPAS